MFPKKNYYYHVLKHYFSLIQQYGDFCEHVFIKHNNYLICIMKLKKCDMVSVCPKRENCYVFGRPREILTKKYFSLGERPDEG